MILLEYIYTFFEAILSCFRSLFTRSTKSTSSPSRISVAFRANRAQQRAFDKRYDAIRSFALSAEEDEMNIIDMESAQVEDSEFESLLASEAKDNEENVGRSVKNDQMISGWTGFPFSPSTAKKDRDEDLEALLSVDIKDPKLLSDAEIKKMTETIWERDRAKSLLFDEEEGW